jgi:3-dehydrosphinganine reductase
MHMGSRFAKTILLTGASDGMGRAVAQILAQKGANLMIVARNVKKLEHTVDELKVGHANSQLSTSA